jgi:hypothetical protein
LLDSSEAARLNGPTMAISARFPSVPLLSFFQRAAERLGPHLDDVSAVRDAIEQGLAQPGVPHHLGPFGKG